MGLPSARPQGGGKEDVAKKIGRNHESSALQPFSHPIGTRLLEPKIFLFTNLRKLSDMIWTKELQALELA